MIRLVVSNEPADLRRLSPPLDRGRVEAWTAELVAGASRGLGEAFAADAARPVIVWRPPVERLGLPQLRFLMRYWMDLAGTRAMPRAKDIDALEMRAALGYVNLLDLVEDGEDFRYRVFGSAIAAACGYDMGGQLVSALKAGPQLVEFTLASYRAVARQGEPLLSEHRPAVSGQTFSWHTLVLPLADGAGKVIRLLVGSVPLTRDGRLASLRL